MTKLFKIVFFLFATFFLQHSNAQGVKVSWASAPQNTVDAGIAYTSSLRVTNTGDKPIKFTADLRLPKNWLTISSASSLVEIPGGQSKIVLLTFRAPNSALARSYPLIVQLKDEVGNNLKKITRKLKIKRGFKIKIENLTKRRFVTSNEEFENSYQIVNNSNVPVELELKARNAKILNYDTIYLRPGESRLVDTKVNAPISYSKISNHVFGLKVECNAFDTIATVLENVEVFPDIKYKEDPYKRFPVNLSLTYLARESNGEYIEAFQGELFARGSLSETKNDNLEIKLKGPDRVQYSLFGNFDEYYAKYTSENFSIWVGDQPLTLTSLTERGRYVRGINTTAKINRVTLQGFYGRSRFFPDLIDEYGSKLDVALTDKFSIGNATIVKNFNAPDSSAIVPTFFANYKSDKFTFSSEVGYGSTGEKDGYAYDVNATTFIGKTRLSARLLNSDLYFPGFLRNSQIATFNASHKLSKLQLGLNANYRNSNPSLDTFFVAAPISYNIISTANYRLSNVTAFEFRIGQTRRTDRFEPKRFDYTEFVNRIGFRQNYETWDYEVYTELGRNVNFLLPEDNNISASYIGGVSGSLKFGENFSVSANMIYQNTNRYSIERTSNFIAGGRLFWKYGPQSRVTVSYRNNYDIENIYQTQDQFELLLDQFIGRNHSVSVSARYAKPRWQVTGQNLFITAKYTYRFDMPFKRKKNLAKIRGNIFTADSVPLEGVRLKITNGKSISDEDGRFHFSRLPFGTYYLTMDRSTLGISQITSVPLPIKVEIDQNNPEANVKVEVVEAGHIIGNIHYPKIKNELLDNKDKTFRPVYIEISNGKERHIQPCDTTGTFSFEYIRPGKWNVRLIESTLDDNFIYNKTKTSVQIQAGETRKLNFKARRKQKQLRMVSPPIKLTAKRQSKDSGGTK